jgi:NAD(P)-dependent dehydrogenase (short-subunit alcohol dehydrogenase family)
MASLDGKVVIVTGGAKGIGKATAHLLASRGAKVAVTDVAEDVAETVAQELQEAGWQAEAWCLDVSVEQQVIEVFQQVHKRFGDLNALVNNAGISGADKPTDQISEEEWDRLMAVNTKGVFLCTKHAIPYLRRRAGGSIVNLSSIYGIVGAEDIPPYHASKGAVRLMTKTDALLYAREGIRVNSVHPGFIWTPLVEAMATESEEGAEEFRRKLDSLHPIGHVGEPEDVAHGIAYLLSDEAKFVTGSELVIDGGYTAQ